MKLEKLSKDLLEIQTEITHKIQKHLGEVKPHRDYPSLYAFVTFNRIADRNKVIALYQESQGSGLFYTLCPCCSPYVPDELKLRKQITLNVSGRVEEPSNIKWENLDISLRESNLRSLVVIFVVIGLMLITFTVIIAANIVKPTNIQNCP